MKIVVISGNAFREDFGGVAEHVKYLLPHLSEFKDIEINLLTFGKKNESFEKNGIKYFVLKRMKFAKIFFPLEIIYDLLRLKREIIKIDPDIIHLQSTIPLFSLFGIYIVEKYPVLLTLHGYIKEENKFHFGIEKIFNRFFSVPLERLALLKIPYIITVCPQIKDLIRKFTNSKIFVVPNGIDLEYIQKIQPTKKFNYPTIFYIGVINKRKGVHDLIRAIPLVKNKVRNVKLYIAGNGPYLNKLKQLIRDLNLGENVTFLGFVSDNEKFAYMKSTDVFVLPTYWESFPFVVIEAMACGKPIITTDVGGNSLAVTDKVNGYLIKPGDWQKLAEKIIYIFNNKKIINKMGEESKKKAQDFDWFNIAKQTREVYRKIIY